MTAEREALEHCRALIETMPSHILRNEALNRIDQALANPATIRDTDEDAESMSVPTYDKCDTYVAGQYVFNYLRTFLAAAGIDASQCKLVIELPDRDTQRQLVSVLQREAKGSPRSAARIGNHSGIWQGVEYEFSVKGWDRLASSTPAEPREASGYCPFCMTADPVSPAEGDASGERKC